MARNRRDGPTIGSSGLIIFGIGIVTVIAGRLLARAGRRAMFEYRRRMRTRAPILGSRIRISGIGLALLMLATILVGGVLGYMVIEGWSWWDAFYMTIITVTTVGLP